VSGERAERFPGMDVMSQQRHWDDVTRETILERIAGPERREFFDEHEFETAAALIGCLLDLDGELSRHLAMTIDGRMAADRTDGWRHDDMPTDEQAWHRSLAALDSEALGSFADADDRVTIVAAVQKEDRWHDLPSGRLFDLWLRYACTAYYAHPDAWNEIGFPGPAYPRGYKNPGVDSREPFEAPDARPSRDPGAERAR
jgi:hypothetical protein